MLFRELAETCEELAKLSGRRDKVSLIVRLLRRLSPEEARYASLLLIGRTLPESMEERLEVSFATLEEALERSSQTTLAPRTPPTILEVAKTLRRIAGIHGPGSREKKIAALRFIITKMSDIERKWFFKQIIGEMQHGVNEGILLEALAELTGLSLDRAQRANMLLGDISKLVELAVREGREGVEAVKLQLFRPIKPMLAENCESVEEALEAMEGKAAFEYKFDGARVHIHLKDGLVKIFSRRLSDVTGSLPDIVRQVKEIVDVREAVFDGEVIAVGKGGKPLPFQELLKRFRRVRDVEEAARSIPLKLRLFDILYLDGVELLDYPYEKRWKLLEERVAEEALTPRTVTDKVDEAEEFLRKSLEEGHEGLMVKRLDSPYRPGKREKLWLKLKPAETLDLVIIAADWGHGRRSRWLSNYHLAVYNPERDSFEVIGKTFKGLTDEEFEWITKKLLQLKTRENGFTVWVKPKIVVEVAYNEIQRSPKYSSGYALRFARIVRIRDDKRAEEADTIQRVRELYQKQFRRKASL